MVRNRAYYLLKPYIPRSVRIGLRRVYNRMILARCGREWPILESAKQVPPGWPGWPENKEFAFAITHDVESQRGVERVRQLAEVETKFGFRSSFNFIPEGSYRVPADLLHWLRDHGFEVGVHDLHHDGKLYNSREAFARNGTKINRYLHEWKAVGFRSGFMLHQLDWLHDLDILYDASTFDTDPFEPQPDGASTIFPYWIAADAENGYVEMPYTLAQDSTLFVYGNETTPRIWLKKLEWVAAHGGLAMGIVHPDYVCFSGRPRNDEFPVGIYEEFLDRVRTLYSDRYWHALAHEIAEHVAPLRIQMSSRTR